MLQQVFDRPEGELRVVTRRAEPLSADVAVRQVVGDVPEFVMATLRTARLAAVAQGVTDGHGKQHTADTIGQIGRLERAGRRDHVEA